jgi:hypothetical protein
LNPKPWNSIPPGELMKRTGIIVVALAIALAALLLWPRGKAPQPVIAPAQAVEADLPTPQTSAEAIRQRLAMARSTDAPAGTNSSVTNLLRRLLSGKEDAPLISREQAEAFAAANGRRADALLAAWRASGDTNFLREAMEKFPNDPRVAFMAWAKSGGGDNDPAAKREWLEKFQRAAPDNALADYLSAREHFKSGDTDTALRELAGAAGKPWRDYTLDQIQNVEEAYRAAGFSEAEAKTIANMGVLLPHLAQIKGLGISLTELAGTFRQSGDAASADAALQWVMQVGKRMEQEGTPTLIQELVAIAMERNALRGLDPNYVLGNSGLTAQQQIEALDQQRAAIREIARDSGQIMNSLSDADLANYFDRLKLFGEIAAVQWAKTRVAAQP